MSLAEEVLRRAAPLYGGYTTYRERIGDSRRLRIFVLEPDGDAAVPPAP